MYLLYKSHHVDQLVCWVVCKQILIGFMVGTCDIFFNIISNMVHLGSCVSHFFHHCHNQLMAILLWRKLHTLFVMKLFTYKSMFGVCA